MAQTPAVPKIEARSDDQATKRRREELARRVIASFENGLPDRRLLCFLDDRDWQDVKSGRDAASRGFYTPLRGAGLPWHAPLPLLKCVYDNGELVFDDLIYLHGTTCSTDVGLAMTLAHEFQHFFQYSKDLDLWAASTVAFFALRSLERVEFEALALRICDIPHEREARIAAKRTAENLFGAESVRAYVETKRAERVTEQDALDWDCIQGLSSSAVYDLASETKRFFPRLKSCRSALDRTLRGFGGDPDFQGVDLDALLAEGAQ